MLGSIFVFFYLFVFRMISSVNFYNEFPPSPRGGSGWGLSFLVLMDAVINAEWSRTDLDEALGLIGCPASLGLTVFAKLRLRQVVLRVDTNGLEAVRTEF